jgi:TonB family protein
MSELFGAAAPRLRRSPALGTLSVVLHVGIVGGALLVSTLTSSTLVSMVQSKTVMVFSPPLPVLDMPVEVLRAPRSIETPPELKPQLPLEAPPRPVREILQARIEPLALEPVPARIEIAPRPMPSAPKAAPVIVGAFPSDSAAVRMPEAVREVRTAGFEPPSAKAPEIKVGGTTVGAFDVPAGTANPRPGTDRPATGVVTTAGFGSEGTASKPPTSPRTVADAGFGAAAGTGRAKSSEPARGDVRTSGFDATPAPEKAAPQAPPPQRIDTPVEILFKPAPAYTDEARALKLEGEVLLEVEFSASSQVRVVRIVRGLGHGLDESAARAAEQMKFKPAKSNGRSIDFRTTVHIVFRLA